MMMTQMECRMLCLAFASKNESYTETEPGPIAQKHDHTNSHSLPLTLAPWIAPFLLVLCLLILCYCLGVSLVSYSPHGPSHNYLD